MTQEELDKKIEETRAANRAAIERADAFFRWFDREVPVQEMKTELAFQRPRVCSAPLGA
jgi:hypothetical protein